MKGHHESSTTLERFSNNLEIGLSPKGFRLRLQSLFTTLLVVASTALPLKASALNMCQTAFANRDYSQSASSESLFRKKPRVPVVANNSSANAQVKTRQLETVTSLKMMAYNVENLFMRLGKFERISDEEFKRITDAEVKPEAELEGIATAITDSNPDFIVMEEVEGVEAIQRFSEDHLNNKYKAMLVEGNDERGIQIGFLVKRDLPLDITLETHKDATWTENGKTTRLFSRDAPALIVRRKTDGPNAQPVMIFIGVHGKSQRDRGSDTRSVKLRTAQYEEVGRIVDGYQSKFGKDVPIMIGGDFNIDVRTEPDVEAVRERMMDPFDIKGIKGEARMTHTYHPRGGRSSYHQLDAIFVSPSLKNSIEDVHVYRYKDDRGNEKPLPDSFEERSRNPSDHFPVVITISTEEIFPEAHAGAAAAGF